MPSCRQCGRPVADEHRFCQNCGRPVSDAAAAGLGAPAEATAALRYPAQAWGRLPVDIFTSRSGELHRAVAVDDLFAFKNQLVFGRLPTCDICLPHPSVSRAHALLERLPQGLRLRDLRSINGVLVGGRRISEPVFLREYERVGIGPYLICLAGGVLHALDSSQSLRLEARNLEKVVNVGAGRTRKLLDNISLAVEPGEFVSLLGPSGSGKSTLLDCLNGRRPATRGRVLANGEDFYLHFDSFRQSLGYVPQRDIVHTQLTVARALYYTARLRLPTDTGPAELRTRMDEVLRLMELEPHRDTLVANLSGGQIKRVSLGAELLARPCLLYIDEATSGLDAGTEARMMRLFQQLAHEGKSVLCITHNVDNVDLCNLIIILAAGKLVYYGPPAESRAYFHTSRISEIYDRLAEKTPEAWEKEYTSCSLFREFVANRLESAPTGSVLMLAPPSVLPAAPPNARSERPHHLFTHQLRVLVRRYVELLWRDYRTLRLLFLQAPIVALFILLGFIDKPYEEEILAARQLTPAERAALRHLLAKLQDAGRADETLRQALVRLAPSMPESKKAQALLEQFHWPDESVATVLAKAQSLLQTRGPLVPERIVVNPSYTYMLLFLLVITILWFGCNNAAKEIIKEEAIYTRERAVNLGILPYLASKFLVLSFITAVQVVLSMTVIYGMLEILHATLGHDLPPAIYCLEYLPQLAILILLAMTGVALGLLLSACVSSPDRASTLLPYVLIPQIILGGGILPVEGEPLHTIAAIGSPAYWAYRAIRLGETELPADFPWRVNYDDNIGLAAAMLITQMVGLLLLTAWFLRRWDARKA
jgi:ABC-type multidrug transport system ATPase subunit